LKPKQGHAKPAPDGQREAKAADGLAPPPSGTRRWGFRLAALALPLLLLLVLEVLLRLFGFGYPTSFFLKERAGGQPVFIENQQFTRRFFPPGLARTPEPVIVSATKPRDTCRIFILGESAAMGDPEPAFGFGRILEVLLRAQYPGRKFEVVNVAVTAINSHVVRQIAQDCAPLHGDVWIIYMGNNEVVGPFGAGTVFGSQTPPLSVIRAQIAFKATRVGQFIEAVKDHLARRPETPATWEGMEMFLKQQIRQDDPRMGRVYSHFQANLEDIVRLGEESGARVLLSTLVSNLKDCPPFGSLHRPNLTAAQLADWDKLYQAGIAQESATNPTPALATYEQAAAINGQFAELPFRRGRCLWALGRFAEAKASFEQAQDLDTLRFRSDTRINQIIRGVAGRQTKPGLKFVDVRDAFAQASPHEIAGEEFLWEHVHFNFAGNYRLACMLAEQVAALLPPGMTGTVTNRPALLSAAECARRLALTDWDRYQVLDEVIKRLEQPPFTGQLGHRQRIERLRTERAALGPALQAPSLTVAAAIYRQAIALAPDDWVLREKFARLLEAAGEPAEAERQWRRVTELVPQHEQGFYGLANMLDAQGKTAEAIRYFRQSVLRRADLYEARNGLGLALASQGQVAEAITQLQMAIRKKPDFAEARVNLGQILAQQGKTDEAMAQYQAALRCNSNSVAAHINLGKLLASQGKSAEGIAHYREALRVKPESAVAHYNLGNALTSQGSADAPPHYAEAVRLQADFAEARFNLGLGLAKEGRTAEALAQFQEVVRLRPDFAEAHLNYGVALAKIGRLDEAAEQFRETLRLDPAHPMAQKYLDQARALRGKGS
jgi:tetratricopeptide (TPR) repeat protein